MPQNDMHFAYTAELLSMSEVAAFKRLVCKELPARLFRAGEPDDSPHALLDIVVADELKTSLAPPPQGADDESWRMRVAAACTRSGVSRNFTNRRELELIL